MKSDVVDFYELEALRKGVPAWAVAVELVARGVGNRNWGGWGVLGKQAMQRAVRRGALRYCGAQGVELVPLKLAN